jgi:HK97 gp10 family phage protein
MNPFQAMDAKLVEIKKAAAEKASRQAVKVAIAVLTVLLEETPIDTGKLVSNWRVNLNSPLTDVIEAHTVGKAASEAAANIGQAGSAAAEVLAQKQSGQPIHITNYTPYVRYLNDGTSRVAAHSFVEKALLVGGELL